MKVVICGSRKPYDYKDLVDTIKESGFDITEIISGGAYGVDTLAEYYSMNNNIPLKVYKPDWNKGRIAGILRNKDMVNAAEAVIALWDGESRGTKSTIEFAKKQNKLVFVKVKVI